MYAILLYVMMYVNIPAVSLHFSGTTEFMIANETAQRIPGI